MNSLWCGVQVPLDAAASSTVRGVATLSFAHGVPAAKVDVSIKISEAGPLHDHGDADTWRLSRLRWLDSTLGSDDSQVPTPYHKVNHSSTSSGLALEILGREVMLAPTGLPAAVSADKFGGRSVDLLTAPMNLELVGAGTHDDAIADQTATPVIIAASNSEVSWSSTTTSRSGSTVQTNGSLQFDGYAPSSTFVPSTFVSSRASSRMD